MTTKIAVLAIRSSWMSKKDKHPVKHIIHKLLCCLRIKKYLILKCIWNSQRSRSQTRLLCILFLCQIRKMKLTNFIHQRVTNLMNLFAMYQKIQTSYISARLFLLLFSSCLMVINSLIPWDMTYFLNVTEFSAQWSNTSSLCSFGALDGKVGALWTSSKCPYKTIINSNRTNWCLHKKMCNSWLWQEKTHKILVRYCFRWCSERKCCVTRTSIRNLSRSNRK